MTIFCPKCDELILDAPHCEVCGWLRPAGGAGAGEPIWRVKLGARFASRLPAHAAHAAGNICLVDEDGKARALRAADGAEVWQHNVPGRRLGHAPLGDGERIYVGTIDMRPMPEEVSILAAFDGSTGETLWQMDADGHSLSNIVHDGDLLAVCSSSGTLRAVEAASGRPLWIQQHGAWSRDCLVASDGALLAGGQSPVLAAFSMQDGQRLWRFEGDSWFMIRPAPDGERLFVLSSGGVLHALARDDGRCQWRMRGERGKGFLTAPSAHEGLVFIGSRVRGSGDSAGYALLALHGEDGSERWRVPTPRPVSAAPVVAGDMVLFGARDGSFLALRADDGAVQWQANIGGILTSQPCAVGAGIVCALQDGTVLALRLEQTHEEAAVQPEVFEARGAYRQAANGYAVAGDLARAAQIVRDRLAEPQHAARLFERAGESLQAGALWEEVGNLERAAAQYEAAGAHADHGRVLSLKGEVLEAARAYDRAGMWREAAQQYERAGDRLEAATLYNRAGDVARARLIYRDLGDWERESETLIGEGQLAEAAVLLVQHGKLERAVDMYEQAGTWTEALALRIELGHWQRAVALAERISAHEEEGKARENLGQPARAAGAYERAADRLLAEGTADEEKVAGLYERAAQLYHDAFDEESARSCARFVRRFRRLPDVVVRTAELPPFPAHQWRVVPLSIENKGGGTALEIEIAAESTIFFKGSEESVRVPGLRPDDVRKGKLRVRAGKDQDGMVPLNLIIRYRDKEEQLYEERRQIETEIVSEAGQLDETRPPPSTTFDNGYALIVGVSDYPYVEQLPAAASEDARKLHSVLCAPEHCAYVPERVGLLADGTATLEAIRNRMNWLAEKATKLDTVLFYFSGHGHRTETADGQRTLLCPYDFDSLRPADKVLDEEEIVNWMAQLQAKHVLLIFDCCYAGGIGERSVRAQTMGATQGLSDSFYRHLGQGSGRVIMASSSADETARIVPGMENSVFTTYLLRALKGEARTRHNDGYIRLYDLWLYISEQVRADAPQRPTKWGDQGDFPIAMKHGGRRT